MLSLLARVCALGARCACLKVESMAACDNVRLFLRLPVDLLALTALACAGIWAAALVCEDVDYGS
jgi:hypothetical protein